MDFIDYANRIGIPWAAVICMLLIAWKGLKVVFVYLGRKFFSDELDGKGKPKGYVPRLVEEQVELMETMKESLKEIKDEVKEVKGKINCPKTPNQPNPPGTTG
jgi:hypothetical protein